MLISYIQGGYASMHQGNLAWTSDSQQTSEGVPLQSWDPVPSHMAACTLELPPLRLIIIKVLS